MNYIYPNNGKPVNGLTGEPNIMQASIRRVHLLFFSNYKIGEKSMKKIAVGCDPNAAGLKEAIIKHLVELGYECEDYGSDDPVYANVAIDVAEAVAAGKHDRGILIIAANKVPGAYAALCSDAYSTERSIKSNNVNIMALGEQVTGVELAKSLVSIWINSEYAPAVRSQKFREYVTTPGSTRNRNG